MEKIELKYSKDFPVQVRQYDTSHHGSPMWKDYDGRNDEEIRFIRKEVHEKGLGIIIEHSSYRHESKSIHFDGKSLARLSYSHDPVYDLERGVCGEDGKYEVVIDVERMGSERSEIENKLLESGFVQN